MRAEDEAIGRLIEIALQLEGLYRHASTHAAGVVLGARPVTELVRLSGRPEPEVKVLLVALKTLRILDGSAGP